MKDCLDNSSIEVPSNREYTQPEEIAALKKFLGEIKHIQEEHTYLEEDNLALPDQTSGEIDDLRKETIELGDNRDIWLPNERPDIHNQKSPILPKNAKTLEGRDDVKLNKDIVSVEDKTANLELDKTFDVIKDTRKSPDLNQEPSELRVKSSIDELLDDLLMINDETAEIKLDNTSSELKDSTKVDLDSSSSKLKINEDLRKLNKESVRIHQETKVDLNQDLSTLPNIYKSKPAIINDDLSPLPEVADEGQITSHGNDYSTYSANIKYLMKLCGEEVTLSSQDKLELQKIQDYIGLENAQQAAAYRTVVDYLDNMGSWGKKFSSYLTAILSKNADFKTYIPGGEVEKLNAMINPSLKEYGLEVMSGESKDQQGSVGIRNTRVVSLYKRGEAGIDSKTKNELDNLDSETSQLEIPDTRKVDSLDNQLRKLENTQIDVSLDDQKPAIFVQDFEKPLDTGSYLIDGVSEIDKLESGLSELEKTETKTNPRELIGNEKYKSTISEDESFSNPKITTSTNDYKRRLVTQLILDNQKLSNNKELDENDFKEKQKSIIRDSGEDSLTNRYIDIRKNKSVREQHLSELPKYQLPRLTLQSNLNATRYIRWAVEQGIGLIRNTKGVTKQQLLDSAIASAIIARESLEKATKTEKHRLPGSGNTLGKISKLLLNTVNDGIKTTISKSLATVLSKIKNDHNSPENVPEKDDNKSIQPRTGNETAWINTKFSDYFQHDENGKMVPNEGMKETFEFAGGNDKQFEDNYIYETWLDFLINSNSITTPNLFTRFKDTEGQVMTLDSNHVWEIKLEPYVGPENGFYSYLPKFSDINKENYQKHGVKTNWNTWAPIVSYELNSKRMVQKTLGLYNGEISYPISMEFTNELRIAFCDDQYKSWKGYFEKVMECMVYSSKAHHGTYYQDDTYEDCEIRHGVINPAPYKNVVFRCIILCMTPQYSTIRKFDFLILLKDLAEEFQGESEAGPTDLSLNFSIVGENPIGIIENATVDNTKPSQPAIGPSDKKCSQLNETRNNNPQ